MITSRVRRRRVGLFVEAGWRALVVALLEAER
jgi:hypothetical protein